MRYLNPFLFSFLLFFSLGCGENADPTATRESFLPPSIGGEYEILVVVNDAKTNDPHVKAIGDLLQRPYPNLNRPEPWFKLSWVDIDDFLDYGEKYRYILFLDNSYEYGKIRKMMGNMFSEQSLAKLEEEGPNFWLAGSNAWAKPQSIIYLSAKNKGILAEKIEQQGNKLLEFLARKEFSRIRANLFSGTELRLEQQKMKEGLKFSVRLPVNFEPAVLGEKDVDSINNLIGINGFKWYVANGRKAFQNVALWTVPYTDTAQLSLKNIIAMRDSVGEQYIPCEDKGSYMGTETRFPEYYPDAETFKQDGRYAVKVSGLWRAINGFQGGPFITYVVVDTDRNQLIFADASVAAKNSAKKKYVVRLKAILSTLKVE